MFETLWYGAFPYTSSKRMKKISCLLCLCGSYENKSLAQNKRPISIFDGFHCSFPFVCRIEPSREVNVLFHSICFKLIIHLWTLRVDFVLFVFFVPLFRLFIYFFISSFWEAIHFIFVLQRCIHRSIFESIMPPTM